MEDCLSRQRRIYLAISPCRRVRRLADTSDGASNGSNGAYAGFTGGSDSDGAVDGGNTRDAPGTDGDAKLSDGAGDGAPGAPGALPGPMTVTNVTFKNQNWAAIGAYQNIGPNTFSGNTPAPEAAPC